MRQVAGLIGLLTSLAILGLYVVFVFFNPYSPGSLTLPVALMILLAVAGVVVSWKAWPYAMLAIFALSFVPVGLYMLGTPGLFRWFGVLDLLYLGCGLLMLAHRLAARLPQKPKSI